MGVTPIPALVRSALRQPGDPVIVGVLGEVRVANHPNVLLEKHPPYIDPDVVVAHESKAREALELSLRLHAPLVLVGWQGRAHVVVGSQDPTVLTRVVEWVVSRPYQVIWPQ